MSGNRKASLISLHLLNICSQSTETTPWHASTPATASFPYILSGRGGRRIECPTRRSKNYRPLAQLSSPSEPPRRAILSEASARRDYVEPRGWGLSFPRETAKSSLAKYRPLERPARGSTPPGVLAENREQRKASSSCSERTCCSAKSKFLSLKGAAWRDRG